MIPIEITVIVEDENDRKSCTELIGVVQLPCAPLDGMKFESPDTNCAAFPLKGLVYNLRKSMFTGLLCDCAPAELLAEIIQSWRDLGFRTYSERMQESAE